MLGRLYKLSYGLILPELRSQHGLSGQTHKDSRRPSWQHPSPHSILPGSSESAVLSNYGNQLSYARKPSQYDWFHLPIPIWIQFEGLVVTARIRLQMVPQIPYARNITFTLMGVPKVELSAIPMSKMVSHLNLLRQTGGGDTE
jgi:hypothetical protein